MKVLNSKIKLDNFFNQLKRSSHSVLILDYDGTLAPFSKNRMDVRIYPQLMPILKKLVESPKIRFLVISGRSLDNLEKLLPFYDSIEAWGSHGLERKVKNGEVTREYDADSVTAMALNSVRSLSQTQKGMAEQFEFKPFGVALHWRDLEQKQQDDLRQMIVPEWEKIVANTPLEIHYFNGGIELRPRGKNKGYAVKTIIAESAPEIPIGYLGDDHTDEEAFEALGDRGLKILVKDSPQETFADLQLVPPDELQNFLEQWFRAQG